MSRYESPEYRLVLKEGSFELREYGVFRVVRVDDSNRNQGFRTLFQYISGNNEEGEKISMTVPVIQTGKAQSRTLAFVVPKRLGEDPPHPLDANVRVEEEAWKYVAVLRFSGIPSEGKIDAKFALLDQWVGKRGWRPTGTRMTAFYDPPFQLPLLRRNEVMIGIGEKEVLDSGERQRLHVDNS